MDPLNNPKKFSTSRFSRSFAPWAAIAVFMAVILLWPSGREWSVYPVVAVGIAMLLALFLNLGHKRGH